MPAVNRFEELEVWKLSRELNKNIGMLIRNQSFEKNFRLIGQIEGSTGSIMDNIAEGFERGSRAEFIQFLGYSKGSCGELRSQLYRALDLQYINDETFDELFKKASRISAMLNSFIIYLQKTNISGIRKKYKET